MLDFLVSWSTCSMGVVRCDPFLMEADPCSSCLRRRRLGISSFRGWLTSAKGDVLVESRGGEGTLHCAGTGFAQALRDHLARLGAPGKSSRPDLLNAGCPAGLGRGALISARRRGGLVSISILNGLPQERPHDSSFLRILSFDLIEHRRVKRSV